MNSKSALVLDTNFIIENKNLQKVVDNLSEIHTVYVTQVSIDERISQKFFELQKKYDNLQSIIKDYEGIAKIEESKSLDEKSEEDKIKTQKSYDNLFANTIIPFAENAQTFSKVMRRLHKKLPPFSSADKASDKGFKDSLIWISILDYFTNTGEDNVIFITNDKGFISNAVLLCKEFNSVTGKKIDILENSYYKTLLEKKNSVDEVLTFLVPSNIVNIREQINDTIIDLCSVEVEDSWGEAYHSRTFTLSEKVDDLYMKIVFYSLSEDISKHIFEISIPANEIFELDDRISNVLPIPMQSLEKALTLHQHMMKTFPDYMDQFYSTAANIFNRNYVPLESNFEESDMPF